MKRVNQEWGFTGRLELQGLGVGHTGCLLRPHETWQESVKKKAEPGFIPATSDLLVPRFLGDA